MKRHKLSDLNRYNIYSMNDHQIALKSGISGPAVRNYMGRGRPPQEPSLPHLAALLEAMGVNLKKVTIADLLEQDE